MFGLKLILKLVQNVKTSYRFLRDFLFCPPEEDNLGKKLLEISLVTDEEEFNDLPLRSTEASLETFKEERRHDLLLAGTEGLSD